MKKEKKQAYRNDSYGSEYCDDDTGENKIKDYQNFLSIAPI